MDNKYEGVRYIFIVGIGGSNQASKALFNALRSNPFIIEDEKPKMFFVEMLTKEDAQNLKKFVDQKIEDKKEFHIFTISKSGKTLETTESFNGILKVFEKKFENINDRITIISEKNTPLQILANENNYYFIEWPEGVGGRFSALTVAHTLPLTVADFDVNKYIESKEKVDEDYINNLSEKIVDGYENGLDILDMFFFDEKLEDLGKWTRQLVAESLGKTSESGEKVGITPTVTIAPKDLHSMLQLYLGGPIKRFTIFIKTEQDTKLGEKIQKEVLRGYRDLNLPFLEYEMKDINEENIGKFMATMMETVKKIGSSLNINVFDQPAVEEYKANNLKND